MFIICRYQNIIDGYKKNALRRRYNIYRENIHKTKVEIPGFSSMAECINFFRDNESSLYYFRKKERSNQYFKLKIEDKLPFIFLYEPDLIGKLKNKNIYINIQKATIDVKKVKILVTAFLAENKRVSTLEHKKFLSISHEYIPLYLDCYLCKVNSLMHLETFGFVM